MGIRVIRQAVLALVGMVLVGVLVFPAPTAAKTKPKTMELHFQGGGEPFGGNPPVGMSMTGPSFKHPRRVTGFTIDVTYNCDGDLLPGVETFPIRKMPVAARIKRDKEKDLTYFSWSWEFVQEGQTLMIFQLLGGQHRQDPRVWRGKAAIRLTEAGIQARLCPLEGVDADGFLHWEARLVKACPGRCESPFSARAPSWSMNSTSRR
jgi:hypothetical protein